MLLMTEVLKPGAVLKFRSVKVVATTSPIQPESCE